MERGWWPVFIEGESAGDWMGVLDGWHKSSIELLDFVPWMRLFPTLYQLNRYGRVYRRLLLSAARRPDGFNLRKLLAPLADEQLTGSGDAFDAPPLNLGVGGHWLLRELVRLEVVNGDQLAPLCYMPSKKLVDLLELTGLYLIGDEDPQVKAAEIHRHIVSQIGSGPATFGGYYDLPLQAVALDEHLQLELGFREAL